MRKPLELSGKKFGRWSVIDRNNKETKYQHSYWNCVCDCGTTRVVTGHHLANNKTSSCGCLNKEILDKIRRKHDMSKSVEYRAWTTMKTRCYSKDHKDYKNYGAKGITVCDRWLKSFENFYADMGSRPDNSPSFRRRDKNGNYEPNNCYWHIRETDSPSKRKIEVMSQWTRYFGNPVIYT
jgi:hypothetical protein